MTASMRAAGPVLVAAALLAFAAPSSARADAATDWNKNATDVLTVNPAGQAVAAFSILHLAMVHGAVYDAVNGIDRGHRPYLILPSAQPWDSSDAAAAAAAHRVLVSLLPAQQTALDTQYATYIAALSGSAAQIAGGVAAGEAAAQAMIAARTNDGRFGPFRFTPSTGIGQWRPELPAFVSDPNAWLKDVKPFMVRSASQFRSDEPDPLTSRRYARDFDEVKSVGAAVGSTRTADQTSAAIYWYPNPPAIWSRIYRTISTQRSLSTVDAARLYAEFYLTASDALITVWESKAFYSFWRPITAIHMADQDGNRRTDPDPGWMPFRDTPPYPEHPSGHSSFTASAVTVLQQFFHSDRIAWTDTNAGETRSFTRASDALEELVSARVWEGIHFRHADEQGALIGKRVAHFQRSHFFQSVRGRGDDHQGEDDD